MSSHSSPDRYRAGPSSTASSNAGYDEERLEWSSSASLLAPMTMASKSSPWTKKYLRLLKPSRTAVYLLLADIFIVAVLVHIFNPLIILLVRNEELFGSRLVLSTDKTIPPYEDKLADEFTIPRILHQTAATEDIPEKWAAAQKTCKAAYSEYEYMLWTDQSARDFLAAEYPWFVDIWDAYPFPIQRADAIRYFILYHYGGIYLDMDTLCNETLPLRLIESDANTHHAIFKSTTPTGVSNDLMITSKNHPLFYSAIYKLVDYYHVTSLWDSWQPYCAIMISAGPLFITMAIKNYLLDFPTLPTPTFNVVNATELLPYITDLESASWHHDDAKALMWIGERPWIWFALGALGLGAGLHLINLLIMRIWRGLDRNSSFADKFKFAKLQ
jgi:mannosyltransferase OCH1-like enzyme